MLNVGECVKLKCADILPATRNTKMHPSAHRSTATDSPIYLPAQLQLWLWLWLWLCGSGAVAPLSVVLMCALLLLLKFILVDRQTQQYKFNFILVRWLVL